MAGDTWRLTRVLCRRGEQVLSVRAKVRWEVLHLRMNFRLVLKPTTLFPHTYDLINQNHLHMQIS